VRIDELQLENFRSYGQLTVDFQKGDLHLLIGQNGAGKTNVLEAISLLSLSKAADVTDDDLIGWNQDYYRVLGNLQPDTEEPLTLEVVCQRLPTRKKVCRRNGVNIPVKSFVGLLPVTYFRPRDLALFSGSPAGRRAFLDTLLCQVSSFYLQHSMQYQRVLKQRNTLLRRIADSEAAEEELLIWDTPLAEAGAAITIARLELLTILQSTLLAELQDLGETWSDAQLPYERSTESRDPILLAAELQSLLLDRRLVDIRQQATTVGPHREDWQLRVAGRNLPQFASRGQERTALLALLFLAVSFLEIKRGGKPVILLDDVFSELDDRHQEALLTSLRQHQVFITATHLPPNLHDAQIWKVEEGNLRPEKRYTGAHGRTRVSARR